MNECEGNKMKNLYDEYKAKLVSSINQVMGEDYVTVKRSVIDDLETTFAEQIGEEKLKEIQRHYGIDE